MAHRLAKGIISEAKKSIDQKETTHMDGSLLWSFEIEEDPSSHNWAYRVVDPQFEAVASSYDLFLAPKIVP